MIVICSMITSTSPNIFQSSHLSCLVWNSVLLQYNFQQVSPIHAFPVFYYQSVLAYSYVVIKTIFYVIRSIRQCTELRSISQLTSCYYHVCMQHFLLPSLSFQIDDVSYTSTYSEAHHFLTSNILNNQEGIYLGKVSQ